MRGAGFEEPVIADSPSGEIGEIACVANPVGAGRVYRGYAGAKDFWGDEECDLIYDAGGEGGAGQVCAAFD